MDTSLHSFDPKENYLIKGKELNRIKLMMEKLRSHDHISREYRALMSGSLLGILSSAIKLEELD